MLTAEWTTDAQTLHVRRALWTANHCVAAHRVKQGHSVVCQQYTVI